ncbi:hypothetical protein BH24ACT5_BH24ACT5_30040 [soil metagenome]
MPEAHELQLLAQSDWRFLLPTASASSPNRIVVFGLSPDDCRSLERLGVATSVATSGPKSLPADVVVVTHDDGVAVATVVGDVVANGCVFWRVSASGLRGLRRLRNVERELRAHGFHIANRFWEPYGLGLPRAFVPLDSPTAAKWYVDRYCSRGSIQQRAAAAALKAGLRAFPFVAAFLVGRVSLTACFSSGNVASVLNVPQIPPGSGHPKPLLLAPGDALNRVVVFPFVRDDIEPLVVLKLSRGKHRSLRTTHEQAVLGRLAGDGSGANSAVPSALGTAQCQDLEVGVETCAPGLPLGQVLRTWPPRPSRQEHLLNACVDWLTNFTAGRTRPVVWGGEESTSWVEAPIEGSIPLLGGATSTDELIRDVLDQSQRLRGRVVPEVRAHYGFRDSNLFVGDHGIEVIDWEGAGPGPPMLDLLDLVLWWASVVSGVAEAVVLERVVADKADRVTRTIFRVVARYARAIELEPQAIPLLIVGRCALRAAARAEHDRTLAAVGANPYVDALHALGRRHRQFLDLVWER